ncbi:MAG: hypothetical protein WCH99_00340 [Verrucomicrobiota bacterium]
MDDKQINTIIGYAVVAIVAYYVLSAIIPFLIAGVIGWVVLKAYAQYQRNKK